MKDIYEPELDARIKNFLERKSRKYPELHLFDGVSDASERHKSHGRPPRVIIHEV